MSSKLPEDMPQIMGPACSLGKHPTCRYGVWKEGAFMSMDCGDGAAEAGKATGRGEEGCRDHDGGLKVQCKCEQQHLMRNIEYVANCYRDQRATARRTGEFVEYTYKMQIISSCTILSMLALNILCKGQKKDWSIIFDPPEVTAVPELCALISCTFTYPNKAKPINNVAWYVCKNGQCKDEIFKAKVSKNIENKFGEKETETGQIKMLDPDLTKNSCSIIMKNIKAEDKNEYAFRVEGSHSQLNTYKPTVKLIIQDEPIMYVPLLSEGEEANLTCSAPFPCPETPPEITWWIKTREGNIIDLKDKIITLTTSKILYLSNLTLTPTSDLHNTTVGCDVSYGSKNISTSGTLEVMYVKTLRILGNGKVMEGDTLSLNCSVESHPPSSDHVWSFNGTTDMVMNQTSAESFTITNVRKEHAGVYGCMTTYRNKILNASITVIVIRDTNESKVNESFSPGSENMPLNDTSNTTGIEDFLKNLDMSKILTFVAGMVCSALIFSVVLCCWVSCHRGKKHKVPTANPDAEVNLEMVQTDVAQTGTNEETPLRGQLNGENPNMAGPTDGAEVDEAVGMDAKEVDYASIDYSLLKDRAPEEGEKEPTDTDYAEIKRDKRGDGKERTVLQDDQIETQDQMEGEEELYSNSQELKS
ncbi:sialic acid-binding Ig-like lectin 8 [Sinocyclocheilus anshuiensis]|uniref:sialic acid-binding Ig-like lectin 8 n=1 Tax=Sinocyclocheilus anshuiensis TaxID=1608454 RepID=UPI0007BA3A7B|nr:PREDICTED: sialic acid-binding Ig-like lectin 8 [Sinocyclocheilus anshuiensis]